MGKIIFGILGVVGLVFIIGGSVFIGMFPGILKAKIKEEMPFLKGKDSYGRWQETPVPITMKYHFFELKNSENYTNLDDIELVERGPYVYDETRHKESINYTNDDNMVSYQENKTYKFNEKASKGLKESDIIEFINFPTLGIMFNRFPTNSLGKVMFEQWEGNKMLPSNQTDLFVKSPVIDILYNGIKYELFKLLNTFKPDVPKTYSINEGKNFLEEEWTVFTGKEDIDKIGQIYKFDHKINLTNDGKNSWIWANNGTDSEKCIELKGTDGTLFAPSVSKTDTLFAFEPQLCRPVYFKYWEESEVQDISTYRFVIPDEYFQNPEKNTENKCYCLEKELDQCLYNGALDISHCARRSLGAPIIMSAPYYNHGDNFLSKLKHLKPKKEVNDKNYGTYLDVEPMTGTVLRAVRRLQVNVRVTKAQIMEITNNTKNTNIAKAMPKLKPTNRTEYIIPVFWIEETAEADDKQADEFKSMVTNKKKLANGLSIAVIVVGALMAISSVYLFIRNK